MGDLHAGRGAATSPMRYPVTASPGHTGHDRLLPQSSCLQVLEYGVNGIPHFAFLDGQGQLQVRLLEWYGEGPMAGSRLGSPSLTC